MFPKQILKILFFSIRHRRNKGVIFVLTRAFQFTPFQNPPGITLSDTHGGGRTDGKCCVQYWISDPCPHRAKYDMAILETMHNTYDLNEKGH